MAFLHDDIMDLALQGITNTGDRVDICSQEPANVTEAISTYTLGNKTSATVGSPTDGDSSGRKVVISAISDGSVTGTDDATHWALSDTTSPQFLICANSLSSSQAVTSGNTFTLPAIDITIPDPS